MDKKKLDEALRENKAFKIGEGFIFAAQIPDDSIGCSGSRCSNCNSKTAYCIQMCEECGLPFIGPFGFPQLPEWESLTLEQKRKLVEKVYFHDAHRGRLVATNVRPVPLTRGELHDVEAYYDIPGFAPLAGTFLSAHGVSPQEIGKRLIA